MTWNEFRQWATRQGIRLPHVVAAVDHYGRILGVEATGSGSWRTYGPREQRRLAMYEAIRRSMGIDRIKHLGGWKSDAIKIAGDHSTGWVCHAGGRTWWAEDVDPLPHLGAGIFAARIWQP
jgi:hypothetical protein